MGKMNMENRLNEGEIKRLERYADRIISEKQGEFNQIVLDEQKAFKESMNENKTIKKTLKAYAELRKKIKEVEKANDLEFVEHESKCPQEYVFNTRYTWESKNKKKHGKEIRKLDRIKRKLEKWTAKNNRQKSMEIIEELEKKANLKKEEGD